MTLIRNTRQEQSRFDRASQEFVDLEYVIDGFTTAAASIQEETRALQSPPPEMASGAGLPASGAGATVDHVRGMDL